MRRSGSTPLRRDSMLVAAAMLLIAACESGLPTAPEGMYAVPHDARFYSVWAQVESCSGLKRNPNLTRRYFVPGERILMRNGETIASYYDVKGDFIVIPEGLKDDDWILGHEILHVLLIKLLGIRGHPEEYFVVRCDLGGSHPVV